MSVSSVCPKCAAVNTPGAKFCLKCGSPLTTFVQPQVPAVPYPGIVPNIQQQAAYNYATATAAQERTNDIDRTKLGLLFLIIGVLIAPVPTVGIIGSVLALVGAILVIVGRKAFGPRHSRNTTWSIIVFVIGIAVGVATALVLVFSSISSAITSGINSGSNPNIAAQAAAASFQGVLIGTIVGSVIGGIAYVLFTYELQRPLGRGLVFSAYAIGIVNGIVEYLIIAPQINSAAQQATATGTVNAINSLTSQLQSLGLLGFIPAILYATAFYLAWSRVKKGEIPGPAPRE